MSITQRGFNLVHPRFRTGEVAQNLQALIDLAQELKADLNSHITEFNTLSTTVGKLAAVLNAQRGSPHMAADATNGAAITLIVSGVSTQSATNTFINTLKSQMNAHFAAVNPVHIAADATNLVEAADSDDTSTPTKTRTLCNELKADLNAHIALSGATGHFQPDTKSATVLGADVTSGTLAQCQTLALEAYNVFIAHCASHALITGSQQAAIAGSEYAASTVSVTATSPEDMA